VGHERTRAVRANNDARSFGNDLSHIAAPADTHDRSAIAREFFD
jgi:hypothetical protein